MSDKLDEAFSWCNSDSFIQDQETKALIPAGTCLKINDYIVLLSFLSNSQLTALRDAVESAVKFELEKRGT